VLPEAAPSGGVIQKIEHVVEESLDAVATVIEVAQEKLKSADKIATDVKEVIEDGEKVVDTAEKLVEDVKEIAKEAGQLIQDAEKVIEDVKSLESEIGVAAAEKLEATS